MFWFNRIKKLLKTVEAQQHAKRVQDEYAVTFPNLSITFDDFHRKTGVPMFRAKDETYNLYCFSSTEDGLEEYMQGAINMYLHFKSLWCTCSAKNAAKKSK